MDYRRFAVLVVGLALLFTGLCLYFGGQVLMHTCPVAPVVCNPPHLEWVGMGAVVQMPLFYVGMFLFAVAASWLFLRWRATASRDDQPDPADRSA